MFLKLPKGNIGTAKAGSIMSKWDTYRSAEVDLAHFGFKLPPPPKGDVPAVQANLLENVQAPEYTTKYAELVAWISFGETLLGSYEAKRLQYRNALKVIGSEIKKKAKEVNDVDKGTRGWKPLAPADVQSLLLADPDYQDTLLKEQEIVQRIELLSGYMKGISRAVALMSRNIELKKLEIAAQSGLQSGRSLPAPTPVMRTPARRVTVLTPHDEHRAPHEEWGDSETEDEG